MNYNKNKNGAHIVFQNCFFPHSPKKKLKIAFNEPHEALTWLNNSINFKKISHQKQQKNF